MLCFTCVVFVVIAVQSRFALWCTLYGFLSCCTSPPTLAYKSITLSLLHVLPHASGVARDPLCRCTYGVSYDQKDKTFMI
ncbi:hypothetical protein BGZ57DRAFT_904055 [Hyaloscypha finlandica]|nr:hypothetical protein BGZ57DRAFT_904055 [Hyaloscypha finlandica]